MALTTYTITGKIAMPGDTDPPLGRAGKVTFWPTTQDRVIRDSAGHVAFVGSRDFEVAADGSVMNCKLIATDAENAQPAGQIFWAGEYRTADKRPGYGITVPIPAFELEHNTTIDTLFQVSGEPITPDIVAEVQELRDEVVDRADDVAGVVATTEGLMTAVDADDDSDFRVQQDARLTAAIEAGTSTATVIYCGPSGNDALFSGLTPAAPKKTVEGAKDAIGPNTRGTIYFLAGDTEAGSGSVDFDDYPVSLVGKGSGISRIVMATTQTGPVLDAVDLENRLTVGGFTIVGDGVGDPTNTNKGIRFDSTTSHVGSRLFDIVVQDTGGSCYDFGAMELCTAYDLVAMPPVDAAANNTPWIEAHGAFNGNNFFRFGLLSLGLVANVGVGGAVRIHDDGSTSPHSNTFDSWWFQSLLIPTDGTILETRGNKNHIADPMFFDCARVGGATGTSHIRHKSPTALNQGGNQVTGVIPGRDTAGNSIQVGVETSQPRNSVRGVKGYRGYNVHWKSGATNCWAVFHGAAGACTDPAYIDDSGVQNNRLIDGYLGIERGAFVQEMRYASDGAAGPRFSDPVTPANGAVWMGTSGTRLRSIGTAMLHVADTHYIHNIAGTGSAQVYWGPSNSYPGILVGAGSPEGVVAARIASQYMRTDGSTSTSHYIKESGTGNAGWVAK